MLKVVRLAVVIALMVVSALAAGQSGPSDDEHHGPRPEAIAACKDKSEGDACEFDGAGRHVSGACRKVRTGDLACVHPHYHHDGGTS
jgi:hypothetical protein